MKGYPGHSGRIQGFRLPWGIIFLRWLFDYSLLSAVGEGPLTEVGGHGQPCPFLDSVSRILSCFFPSSPHRPPHGVCCMRAPPLARTDTEFECVLKMKKNRVILHLSSKIIFPAQARKCSFNISYENSSLDCFRLYAFLFPTRSLIKVE